MAQTNFRAQDMPGNSGSTPETPVPTPEPTPEPAKTEEKPSIPADATPKKAGTKGSGARKKPSASDEPETHEYTVERDGEQVIKAEGVENNG